MTENNAKVLTLLMFNKDFRDEMEKDVDNALKTYKDEYGLTPDDDFVEKLKEYGSANGFANIHDSNVNTVNDSLAKHFELDSRW